mmetsp:Transcript_44339/g.86754  ORF Transcript_44339/g.86754 Transcript_44339/m.86754 type:complete len:267 (-) Transcript_44339:2315-3115(-)
MLLQIRVSQVRDNRHSFLEMRYLLPQNWHDRVVLQQPFRLAVDLIVDVDLIGDFLWFNIVELGLSPIDRHSVPLFQAFPQSKFHVHILRSIRQIVVGVHFNLKHVLVILKSGGFFLALVKFCLLLFQVTNDSVHIVDIGNIFNGRILEGFKDTFDVLFKTRNVTKDGFAETVGVTVDTAFSKKNCLLEVLLCLRQLFEALLVSIRNLDLRLMNKTVHLRNEHVPSSKLVCFISCLGQKVHQLDEVFDCGRDACNLVLRLFEFLKQG